MKNSVNKNRLVSLMFLSLSLWLISTAKLHAETDLYIESGFPYKNLVERYKTVKIHYSDLQETGMVQCRVELISNQHTSETEYVQVTPKKFAKEPLKSCIERKEAISALKLTFSD